MVDSKLLSARDMHRAVVTDPQFRVPRRPALCRGLVTVPLPDGILVEGAAGRQVLRGAATRELIPKLLPLFDGTREVSAVAAAADVRVEHVEQARALLYTCGLLEEGAPQDPDATADGAGSFDGDGPVARYLSRNLDSTRVNISAFEAARRLTRARVAVAGDGPICALVRDELAAVGVAADVWASPEPSGDAQLDLVVAIGGSDTGAEDMSQIGSWCAEHAVPLLPVHVTGPTLDVGPYIDESFTLSFGEAERQRTPAPPSDERPTGEHPEPLVLAALIVSHATALIARVGSTPVLRGRVRTDLVTWQQSVHVTAPVPERTDGGSTLAQGGVPLAVAFETSVAFPPRRLLNPRDHQMHYKPGNIVLQRESKQWPSALTVALPGTGTAPLTPLRDGSAPLVSRVDLGHLTSVLLRGAGLRQDPAPAKDIQRWAPTGGNLGSVQLHALVRDVEGLPSGVWGYETAGHRMALLSERNGEPAVAGGQDAPVTIVLTGALARVASKYSAFAWRVVHLDAGVALAQMCHVASSLGLRAQPLDRWDDLGLAEVLDLDLESEPITGVLTLHPSVAKES
ncbi:nitroreductase family protein [Streptomyces sp. ISL-43]|uniref:nitroreductase family protein n=1 Tax=Streptomyces sp. ISL-43 TaxID=2819183 RepID=UPI001BE6018F|nr:nitroreductase family protein [Streptomyces sp. ISL-43]MBT2445598.1 nitroreductase family protein [Streptomyces sp. ISL-43]